MAFPTYPPAMRRLVNELTKLPAIGEKSAVRLAYHLVRCSRGESRALAEAIIAANEQTVLCNLCFSLSEEHMCSVCKDHQRERSIVCVVEKPADVIALERSGKYRGLYHVLHGLWSPLRGVNPEQTKLGALLGRLRVQPNAEANGSLPIRELVLATSATVEGDATALYIARSVADLGLTITRIAQGLPKGGELEYADELTLGHAIEGRRLL